MTLRVVVVRLSALGDVVQSTGAVAALVEARPDVEVHWCVQQEFAPALDQAPFVHGVIAHDRRGGWRAMRATAARLRSIDADYALDLQGNWKSAWLVRASRAQHRVGLAAGSRREPWSAVLLPTRVKPEVRTRHPADLAVEVVRHVAPSAPARFPQLVASAAEVAAEREALARSGIDPEVPFTVMIAGGDDDPRDWPSAMRTLETQRSEQPVVWLVGPQDRLPTDWKRVAEQGPVRLVHGPGALRRLVALGRVVATAGGRVIGPDRGPTHVLAAAGAETIAMFGPQDPAATAPPAARILRARSGPDCVPCRRRQCHHLEGPVCMRFTTAEGVDWRRALRD